MKARLELVFGALTPPREEVVCRRGFWNSHPLKAEDDR